MKKTFLILFFNITINAAFAQYVFPNFSFENWTNGEADFWNSNNVQGLTTPITKSTDAHSGSFAIKGEVTNFNTWTAPNLGSYGSNLFPVEERYPTLNFYYKFNKLNNDVIVVTATIYTADNYPIGFINARITGNAPTYTPIAIPVLYVIPDSVPAQMAVLIGIQDTVINTATPGSYFIFDDFSMGWFTALGVEENTFANENVTVFSNPAKDFISFSVPEQNPENSISVLDITGKQVVKPFISKTAKTEIPIEELANGIYFLNIRNLNNLRVKKLVISH